MATIRVFDYLPELDAFVATPEYVRVADRLGLVEWNPVVWLGRLFTLDNDYGEHWFDNWDERASLEEKAREHGINSDNLLVVVADRFENGKDGPCHPPAIRKAFWTDVLKSLQLSDELLFEAARFWNERNRHLPPEIYPAEFHIADLEERIVEMRIEIESLASATRLSDGTRPSTISPLRKSDRLEP